MSTRSSTTATSSSHGSSTSRRSTRTRSSPSATGRSASCAPSFAGVHTGRYGTASSETGCGARPGEPRLLPAQEPAEIRTMQDEDRERGNGRERDHRPGVADEPGPERERERGGDRSDRRIARQAEDGEPHDCTETSDDRSDAEKRSARRRDDLAAALEAEEERPIVAEHRSGTCE